MTSRLRVLQIAAGDGWGGAEQSLLLLCGALRERSDVEVEVLLSGDGHLAQALRSHRIETHVIDENDMGRIQHLRAVREWAGQRRFDLLHAHRYREISASVLVSRMHGPKIVVTVHGLEPWPGIGASQAAKVWGSLWLARLAGAHFTAVSSELCARLARRLCCPVTEICNPLVVPGDTEIGLDLRRQFGWKPDCELVGFVGRLEHVKGPDRFLEVVAAGDPTARFVVIGSGSLSTALRERVTGLGLEPRVGFAGFIEGISGRLGQLSVLALTSRHEGAPMVLLEAAVAGVPIVATDVGGVRDLLRGNEAASVVAWRDGLQFWQEVRRMLQRGESARIASRRWAASARARHSPEQVAGAYVRVYEGAMAR